jgi:three-Cys-motif partner protein
MWAARLVLELEPKRVRHFHLFERDPAGVRALDGLAVQHHGGERIVLVHSGDMNVELVQWLAGRPISEREATFCLLDQRMFECRWSTLEALARYKREGLKIELFYFLAEKWFHRSLAAQRDPLTPIEWWGRPDYEALYGLRRWERAGWFVERFRRELGYGFAAAWPILARSEAGAPVMYYMIHATDHPEARELMARAYRAAVLPKGQQEHFGWRLLQQQGSPPAAEVLEELGLLEDLPPEHD